MHLPQLQTLQIDDGGINHRNLHLRHLHREWSGKMAMILGLIELVCFESKL